MRPCTPRATTSRTSSWRPRAISWKGWCVITRTDAAPPFASHATPPCRLTLNAGALKRNLGFLRRVAGRAEVALVIKGNAYGHGIETLGPLAESLGVRTFAVGSADEALRARSCLARDTDVMILSWISQDELEWAIESDVSFWVFELGRLRDAAEAAARVGRPARVHLELETGMHRTGLAANELEEVAAIVRTGAIRVEGTCTHYAGAESEGNFLRVQSQIETFRTRVHQLAEAGVAPGKLHTASSAATFLYPETRLDLVRVGIAAYGFWPSQETKMRLLLQASDMRHPERWNPLRRVLRWTTRVVAVNDVDAGEYVGYGMAYLTPRPQRIAAIPVGYYHGFARALSNVGQVLLRGRLCPVVGTVSMNVTLVDVTDCPAVETGDEVVLIGSQGRREISVSSFGDLARILNYEVLVRIPPEIPRVVVD
ncbi:MAG: alanine racemase [bacterium]